MVSEREERRNRGKPLKGMNLKSHRVTVKGIIFVLNRMDCRDQ